MSLLYNGNHYPMQRINVDALPIQSLFMITKELEYNPVLIVKQIYGSYTAYASFLWLVNNIQNPFKELHSGLLLKVPYESAMTDAVIPKKITKTTVQVKQARISGNKIIY